MGQGGLGEAPGKARHEEDRRKPTQHRPETKAFAPGSTAPGEAPPRLAVPPAGRGTPGAWWERQARPRPSPLGEGGRRRTAAFSKGSVGGTGSDRDRPVAPAER